MTLPIDIRSCQGLVKQANAYSTLRPPSPLNLWVKELWQLNVPEGQYSYRSVPDNCVDMIVSLTLPEEIFIVTPFSTAKVFEMTGPISYFGVRFHVLAHHGLINAPIGAWSNVGSVVDINDSLLKHDLNALYDDIYKPMSFLNRCEKISNNLLRVLQAYKADSRLVRFILYCKNNTIVDLSDRQCSKFGLSARQLRRLSAQYLGLSPKEFSKTVRFQNILQEIRLRSSCGSWLNSYYDQSHFNRDFKNMSGVSPGEFTTTSVLYNTR